MKLMAWKVRVGDFVILDSGKGGTVKVRQATYHTADTSEQYDQVILFFEGADWPLSFPSTRLLEVERP